MLAFSIVSGDNWLASSPMPTKSPTALYFLSLELENTRCFGRKQELKLCGTQESSPAQWTLLVGENGVGKTTLLQCLAWMRPVPRIDPGTQQIKGMQPALADEDNQALASLLRDGQQVTASLSATLVHGSLGQSSRRKPVVHAFEIQGNNNLLQKAEQVGEPPRRLPEPFVLHYAANRSPSQSQRKQDEGRLSVTSETGIVDLQDAEAFLNDLDYEARDSVRARRALKTMKQVLAEVLPQISADTDIRIHPPTVLGEPDAKGGVWFEMPYGSVPFAALSLGYRVTTAWILDMAVRFAVKYPESSNPIAEPAIVLVDEIDLHLHPEWQRRIMQQLTSWFGATQFIVTAHSPLMVQAAGNANVAVLAQVDDQVLIENDPVIISGWRVDQILSSGVFGHLSARSLATEELVAERDELLQRSRRSSSAERRLSEIESELALLPTAERPEDEEAMQVIREAAKLIQRSRKLKN